MIDLRLHISEIPNWPTPGVNFKDITPLLQNPTVFRYVIDEFTKLYNEKKVDVVVGIDARGFILASALAYKLGVGLVIVRKKGKLPRKTISREYSLEYASNVMEMHEDAIKPGQKVLIVDDVLATGGTMEATCEMVEKLGGEIVGVNFLMALDFLSGIEKLKKYSVTSLVHYGAEPQADVGIIGGSGFYSMFESGEEVFVDTPYGPTSASIRIGEIAGRKVAFMPRHGANHEYPPHQIPYRANLWALKKLGVKQIIAPSAAGSLQAHIRPGDFVICDQFLNQTSSRKSTFYDGPDVRHVSAAEPYCPALREVAVNSARMLGIPTHDKGTVVVIEGPRFTTKAESHWYQTAGFEVINMTQYPEAILARELEMCYVNISLITDYDAGLAGKEGIAAVDAATVGKIFTQNIEKLKNLIKQIITDLPAEVGCSCQSALSSSKL